MSAEPIDLRARVDELLAANTGLVEREREQRRRAERAEAARDLVAEDLLATRDRIRLVRESFQTPLLLEDYHEDFGPVLWWFFPVVEPPYCGTPLDSSWPGYHTHWTILPGVLQPDGAEAQPTRVPEPLLRQARGA